MDNRANVASTAYVGPRAAVFGNSAGWLFCLAGCMQLLGAVLTINTADTIASLVADSTVAAESPEYISRSSLTTLSGIASAVGIGFFTLGVLYAAGRAVPRLLPWLLGIGGGCCATCGPAVALSMTSQVGWEAEAFDADLQRRLVEELPAWYEAVTQFLLVGGVIAMFAALLLVSIGTSAFFGRR